MSVCIYALVDPRTEKVRYVGQSIRPFTRFYEHLARHAEDPVFKSEWIRELREAGFLPTLRFLDEVSEDDADEAERKHIAAHASLDLLNGLRAVRKVHLRTKEGGSSSFERPLQDLNLRAVACGNGGIFRSRPMMPCPVCAKFVMASGLPKTPNRHKFKGIWCKGGFERRPVARTPKTAGSLARANEWADSKEARITATPKEKVLMGWKAKREREADAWLEGVKARKAPK